MNRIVVTSRVGSDGIRQLAVTVGTAEADRAAPITIKPVVPSAPSANERRRGSPNLQFEAV